MNFFQSFFQPDNYSTIPAAVSKPTVVWIHGANSSSLSFAYLRSNLNFEKEILINYSSMTSFYDNLETMKKDLAEAGPVFFVGHSLGGLYALHLTEYTDAIGGVSISTPFKGSFTADWAKYMVPNYPLFNDVGRRSKPVLESLKIKVTIPWTQIVSTAGSVPYHGGENDGVVTLSSMRARDDVDTVELAHTHYEIVLSPDTVEIILQKYNSIHY